MGSRTGWGWPGSGAAGLPAIADGAPCGPEDSVEDRVAGCGSSWPGCLGLWPAGCGGLAERRPAGAGMLISVCRLGSFVCACCGSGEKWGCGLEKDRDSSTGDGVEGGHFHRSFGSRYQAFHTFHREYSSFPMHKQCVFNARPVQVQCSWLIPGVERRLNLRSRPARAVRHLVHSFPYRDVVR